jgi:hypothetical protein
MRKSTILAVLVMALPSGCQRANQAPVAGTSIRTVDDYRKLMLSELLSLVRSELGSPGIALNPDGPNQYKGTIPSPDGTVMLPLEVTVEAQRIVCVTKTPAGSTTNVITPQGVKSDLQMK